jgi:hypothetical protein
VRYSVQDRIVQDQVLFCTILYVEVLYSTYCMYISLQQQAIMIAIDMRGGTSCALRQDPESPRALQIAPWSTRELVLTPRVQAGRRRNETTTTMASGRVTGMGFTMDDLMHLAILFPPPWPPSRDRTARPRQLPLTGHPSSSRPCAACSSAAREGGSIEEPT